MTAVRRTWSQLGGQLGLGCIGVGIVLIGLGWNGAAGVDFTQGQIPYLLSGGALGLGLIITGATLIIVQNGRRDRVLLEGQLRELNQAVGRLANALGSGVLAAGNGHATAGTAGEPHVVLGASSYHRPDCRLAEGKDLPVAPVAVAEAEGLTPCRICRPDVLETVAPAGR
ncbi:MAG: hypothetical protein JWO37_1600 [Acidimicrobiales bacterium]|jgi:hypothetical protein|nr:hypothetical protein [Acidimicrobiales bacterium]